MPQEENMNKNKLKKLEQEFPFLKNFLEQNFGAFLKDKKTTLEINVKRMDANLFFYHGDHIDGHQSQYIGKKQYGSLFTGIFFTDGSSIIRRRYGKFPKGRLVKDFFREDPIRHFTKFIIKSEITTWYDYEKDKNGHVINTFKHFSKREVEITIYKEAEEKLIPSWNNPKLIAKVHLTNKLWYQLRMYNNMQDRKSECAIMEVIFDKIKGEFKEFFEKYLQTLMYKERAFDMPIEGISFRSLSMAGRLMITLDTPNAQITYIAVDEEKGDSRMGVNSIDGTLWEAEEITRKVISICTQRFEKGESFADIFKIGKVGFAGRSFGTDNKEKKSEQPV